MIFSMHENTPIQQAEAPSHVSPPLNIIAVITAGPKVVSDGGKLVWPQGKFDICGDPVSRKKKFFNYSRSIAGAAAQEASRTAAMISSSPSALADWLPQHCA